MNSPEKPNQPIFFICARCLSAAFEPPFYEMDKAIHIGCSKLKVETKPIILPQNKHDPTKPTAKIYFDDDVIVIDHPFNPKLNAGYHSFYAFKWNKDKRRREIKKDKVNSVSAHFLIKEIQIMAPMYNWDRSPEVVSFLNELDTKKPEYENKIKELNDIKNDFTNTTDVSHLKMEPFGYQKSGIAFLEQIDGVGLIGDEMGLGKTIQALGYTSKLNLKTIVITLASLKFNWKKEVEKFTDKKAIVIDKGFTKDEFKNYDYFITNYEQLPKWFDELEKMKFDCVILDESHSISNISAKRTKNVFSLFKGLKHRILLSGTPSKNRPMELYPQLKFLKPKEFPNKNDFGMKYCSPTQGYGGYLEFKGASNLDELNKRMAPFYIRRLKKDVLKDLPDKRVSNLIYELEPAERKEYAKQTKDFLLTPENKYDRNKAKGHLIQLMKSCSKAKVPHVIEFITEMLREDPNQSKKVVVFAHFRETQQLLKSHFKDIAVSLFGDDTAEARQAAVDKFQTDSDTRIFIGSTKAAGTGITLTAADTVIFADLLWTPADHLQAEDRLHRVGQKGNVFVYYMTFADTVEDLVWRTLQSKLIVVSQTVGDLPFDENAVLSQIITTIFKEAKE